MSSVPEQQVTCPVCGSDDLRHLTERDIRVCESCSYVIPNGENTPDEKKTPKWQQEKSTKSGGNDNQWENKINIEDKSDSELVDLLSLTEEVGEKAELNDEAIIRCGEIVVDAWKSNFMHGRRSEETVAAAVYIAGRESHCAPPPGAIADMVHTDKSRVKKTYLKLKDELEVNVDPPNPNEYVEYICSRLGLSQSIAQEAKNLLDGFKLKGSNPIGVACGAIYETSSRNNEQITLREIGSVSNITKETVWRQSEKFSGL